MASIWSVNSDGEAGALHGFLQETDEKPPRALISRSNLASLPPTLLVIDSEWVGLEHVLPSLRWNRHENVI